MSATPLDYRYVNKEGTTLTINIQESSLIDSITKAKSDIDDSRKFYQETFYPLWREGYKMYHLSTADRQTRIKKWQQNAAFGMVRSFTDVFASTLTEKPITFNVTGVNKMGRENADKIRNSLAYAADVTGFQEEVKESLKEALKTGTFAADINYVDKKEGRKYPVYYPDATEEKDKIKMVAFDDDEIGNVPEARHMSVFSFFADPYNGNEPLHVSRRRILSPKIFESIYGAMIDSEENKSPCKVVKDFLGKNTNAASFLDHETIVDMIHRERAQSALARDSYTTVQEGSVSSIVNGILSIHSQERTDKGNIEAICYTRADEVVLFANNYPVYVGINTVGFITQEIQSATSAKRGADCEGIAYMVGDIARLYDAFGNSQADNVRQVADPTFIGVKGAFLDEESIEDMEPGSIQWAEDAAGASALRRLDKGGASDFGMMTFLFDLGSKLVGVSEYNLGGSTKERTATGALSVSQSASRRLSPFMQNFVSFISRIAKKWLILMKNEWTEQQWITINDEDVQLSNKDLMGGVVVTLQMDSMISAINEFMYKKLLEIGKEYRGSGLINEDELMREMFRSNGLDPSRFVPQSAPPVTPPEDVTTPGPEAAISDFNPTPAQENGMIITEAVTPQVAG